MKKAFFIGLLGLVTQQATAQVLSSENFDALPLGTLSAQSGLQSFGGDANSFAITSGNGGKMLSITGTTGATDAVLYAWKGYLDTAWNGRTAGNNVIQVEYDLFTGPAPLDTGYVGGMELFKSGYELLAGFSLIGSTKELVGLYTPANQGSGAMTSAVQLGAAPNTPLLLPANTCVRIGFSLNTVTGEVKYKVAGTEKTITGALVGTPQELDHAVQLLGAGSNSPATFSFDNVVVQAVAASSLLGTAEASATGEGVRIYPNPSSDLLTVETSQKIEALHIYTSTGMRIESPAISSRIQISHLPSGAYLLGIKTSEGYRTVKFVKK